MKLWMKGGIGFVEVVVVVLKYLLVQSLKLKLGVGLFLER